jgi:hypothetical protein
MEDPSATDAIRIVAKSIAPDVVLANLLSDAPAAIYGGVTYLSGTFTLPDKKPLASLPVRIEIKTATTDWTPVFTGATNAAGVLSVPIIIGENTKARMISDPTWERLEGRTPEVLLQAARKITWLSAPTSVKHGVEFTLTGKVTPAPISDEVVVLTLTDGAKLRKSVSADSSGTFSIKLIEPIVGIRNYQLNTSPGDKYIASTSDFVTVVVR